MDSKEGTTIQEKGLGGRSQKDGKKKEKRIE